MVETNSLGFVFCKNFKEIEQNESITGPPMKIFKRPKVEPCGTPHKTASRQLVNYLPAREAPIPEK